MASVFLRRSELVEKINLSYFCNVLEFLVGRRLKCSKKVTDLFSISLGLWK